MGPEEIKAVVDSIAGYGALGSVTIYFMYKDMTVNKDLTSVIKDFTITLKTFIDVCTVKNGVGAK